VGEVALTPCLGDRLPHSCRRPPRPRRPAPRTAVWGPGRGLRHPPRTLRSPAAL